MPKPDSNTTFLTLTVYNNIPGIISSWVLRRSGRQEKEGNKTMLCYT